MLNALTIDVEDWYHTLDFNFPMEDWGKYEDRVEYSLKKLIDVLAQNNMKATFFVLGCIAKKHPELVRQLDKEGHEIASHGSFHKLIYNQTEQEFREDLLYSKNILEDIIGKKVDIFRASSWSVSQNTLWALRILEEEGFICDSSMQPFKTYLSGISGAPVAPFHPVVNGENLKIVEYPPTVLSLGKLRIPFCGGFYLRAVPLKIIEGCLRQVNKKRNGLIYVHPWEVDTKQPRLRVSPLVKLSHYYNLNSTIDKFQYLLKHFEFAPLGEIIRQNKFPQVNLNYIKSRS